MKKSLSIGIGILLSVMAVVTLVFSFLSSLWDQNSVKGMNENWRELDSGWSINEKYTDTALGSYAIWRTFYESDRFWSSNSSYMSSPSLFFMTHNQNVRVFLITESEEKLVYSQGNGGGHIVGSENGNVIHAVRLSNVTDDRFMVVIQFLNSFQSTNLGLNQLYYKMLSPKVPKIYYGWMQTCYSSFFRESFNQLIPILIQFFVFLLCIFVAIIFREKKGHLGKFLFLGVFALQVSFAFLLESNYGAMLILNSYACYFMSTLLLALFPFTFMLYMLHQKFLWIKDSIAKVFIFWSLINAMLACVCSFIEFIPFSIVRAYFSLVLIAVIVYTIVAAVHEMIVMKEFPRSTELGIFVAGPCILLDLISSRITGNYFDVFFFSRLGMTFFLVVNAGRIVVEFHEQEIIRARSIQQKTSSSVDIVTGCQTYMQMWRHDMNSNIQIALFNVKNLADYYTKDDYANAENVLRSFSRILKSVFDEDRLFRVNGGKFAVLLEDVSDTECGSLVFRVMQSVKEFNELKLDYSLDVVQVYSRFKPGQDMNFDGMLSRMMTKLNQKALHPDE